MKATLLFLTCSIYIICYGQSDYPQFIQVSAKTGFLTVHTATMSHLVKNRSNTFEVAYVKQDNSKETWSQAYRLPLRGYALSFQDFGNRNVLGKSLTFFRFTNFPLLQSRKYGTLDFRLGNGLSFFNKKYDKYQNVKNIAIGSYINGFVNLQLSYTKYFKHLYLGTGIDFSHFSNAATKMPNLGLNTISGFLTIGYQIEERVFYNRSETSALSLPPREKDHFHVHFIASIKQNLPNFAPSRNFGVVALQSLYKIRLNYKWDFEPGIDVIYNEANRWFYGVQPEPVMRNLQIGAYLGLSANIYKTQLFFGAGVYVLNQINAGGWIYNRVGARYLINEHWDLALAIKAHIGIADYLEFGLGYRF